MDGRFCVHKTRNGKRTSWIKSYDGTYWKYVCARSVSKPIIDIDIIFDNQEDFEKIKGALLKMGYYHNGNQGIKDRDVFKRNAGWTNEILDNIKHHLYVCPADSKALERHILSRDFLRNNDWAKLKYQQIKYELAEKANQDKKIYAELKELNVNDFIDSMIGK